jgi:hypothetical protein
VDTPLGRASTQPIGEPNLIVSLRTILTKPRSRERLVFGAIGALLLVYSARQASRSLFGVAAILAIFGALSLVAAATLSERALQRLGILCIFVNVVAAAIALF